MVIIVRVCGGLGNQLYHYALGKAYSKKKNCDLLFDITPYKNFKLQNDISTSKVHGFYCLKLYKTDVKIASPEECNRVKRLVTKRIDFPKYLKKLLRISDDYISHNLNYKGAKDNKFLYDFKGDLYFNGHFRSQDYLKDCRDELIKDFTLDIPLDEKNLYMLHRINSTNSVSLHIRRGDYVRLNHVLSFAYYKRAIDYICKKEKNPHFYVFSNDANWVRENLNINAPFTPIDINPPNKGFYDLELMRNCKHNIIANSTFSWWGAWLNQNPDKVVIAPYAGNTYMYPETWKQVKRE